jgi:hypothetical protein
MGRTYADAFPEEEEKHYDSDGFDSEGYNEDGIYFDDVGRDMSPDSDSYEPPTVRAQRIKLIDLLNWNFLS